jgi:hypothetical protein
MVPFYFIGNVGTLLGTDVLIDYPRHMFLAHVLLQSPDLLKRIVTERANIKHIILDNGAYESSMVTDSELFDLAEQIRPDAMVLPDLPGESSEASFERSMMFLRDERYAQLGKKYTLQGTVYRAPVPIICPQGKDTDDALAFAKHMEGLSERLVIGMGLVYKNWLEKGEIAHNEDARRQMLWEYRRTSLVGWPWHLLGARWDGLRDLLKLFPDLVGVDTYKPCRLALGRTRDILPEHVPHISSLVAKENYVLEAIRDWCSEGGLYDGHLTQHTYPR